MSLRDGLISQWPFDEAAGNALDAHGNNELRDPVSHLSNTSDYLPAGAGMHAVGNDPFEAACWFPQRRLTPEEFELLYNAGTGLLYSFNFSVSDATITVPFGQLPRSVRSLHAQEAR